MKRRASGGAALFAVGVGKHPFNPSLGESINVGGFVAHHTVHVTA